LTKPRLLSILAVISLVSAQPEAPRFVDIAQRVGLTAKNYSGGEIKKKYIVEMNGSGLGFIDYDRNGYPDLSS